MDHPPRNLAPIFLYGNKKTEKNQGRMLIFFWLSFTIKSMGRPKKEKSLLMNRPLRIMLTAEQDELIRRAAELEGVDMTAWVRPILLQAARERVEGAGGGQTKKPRR